MNGFIRVTITKKDKIALKLLTDFINENTDKQCIDTVKEPFLKFFKRKKFRLKKEFQDFKNLLIIPLTLFGDWFVRYYVNNSRYANNLIDLNDLYNVSDSYLSAYLNPELAKSMKQFLNNTRFSESQPYSNIIGNYSELK